MDSQEHDKPITSPKIDSTLDHTSITPPVDEEDHQVPLVLTETAESEGQYNDIQIDKDEYDKPVNEQIKVPSLLIDVNIPFYLYNCPQRMLATEIVLENYYRISKSLMEKYNVKLTLTTIGSEMNKSKNFIQDYCKNEYTYHEFDQKNITPGKNYKEHKKSGFFTIELS